MIKNIFMFALMFLMGMGGSMLPASADPDRPTEGCLRIVGDKEPVCCPLEHTDVSADISGFTGKVTVEQKFKNKTGKPIEAEYIFPLPEMAAVDSMTMKIGDKTVRAEIKKKEEAKKIYDDARQSGKRTALLSQERTNIFTQRVANIMPGDSIIIKITYVETVKYKDGTYEFVFPMVVGPRYIPGEGLSGTPVTDDEEIRIKNDQKDSGWDMDQSRIEKSKAINPPVIPEGMRAGHDIAIKVNVKSPVSVKKTECVLHKVTVDRKSDNEFSVRLNDRDNIPNKDFILRYTTAGDKIEEGIIAHTDAKKGGFFSLYIQPPKKPSTAQIYPKEMVFVVDNSGSQSGQPIEKAKETMKYCIDRMNPDDTFNVIAFSNTVNALFDKPMKNTPETRKKGVEFIESLRGQGGTEMLEPMKQALSLKADPQRLRIVTVMTDGYIGNDRVVCDAVMKNLGKARVFVFGTGNSVNRFLIEKMAKAGKGEAEIITLSSPSEEIAESFYNKIGCPLMTDIKADWGTLPVTDVLPENQPDLFSGKPIVFTGRYSKGAKGTLSLSGISAGRPFVKKIDVSFPDKEDANSSLPVLWARTKIETLTDTDLSGIDSGKPKADVKEEVTKLGLDYNLVTDFTSFVAVEEKIVNKDGKSEKVSVPVEMPDGVSREGVFGAPDAAANFVGGAVHSNMVPARSPGRGFGFFGGGKNSMAAGRCCVAERCVAEDLADGCPDSMPAPDNRRKIPAKVKLNSALSSFKTLLDKGWKPSAEDSVIPESVIKENPSLRNLNRICLENGKVYALINFSCSREEAEKICGELGIQVLKPSKSAKFTSALYVLADPEKLFLLEKNSKIVTIDAVDKKKTELSLWDRLVAFFVGLFSGHKA